MTKKRKESFEAFKKHIEAVSREVESWPAWMREGGRATMGLRPRPREPEVHPAKATTAAKTGRARKLPVK